MANIMFAWERGGGRGHITPHIPLLLELVKRGHRLLFAVKDTTAADACLSPFAIPFVQAPHPGSRGPEARRMRPLDSLPQMFFNIGYHDPVATAGKILAWRQLFELFGADRLLVDFAPTALLAARGTGIRTIAASNGFFFPPEGDPLPSPRFWMKANPDKLKSDESILLTALNQAVARLGMPPVERVSQLIRGDGNWLRGIPELDGHAPRSDLPCYPFVKDDAGGEVPAWPAGEGPRIFGYLKPSPVFRQLIGYLRKTGCPVLIYAPAFCQSAREKLASATLAFSDGPLRMDLIARDCDLAVMNASYSTVQDMMIAGKPMLLLAEHFEHLVIAHRVAEAEAGLLWSPLEGDSPARLGHNLQRLLTESQWAGRAAEIGRALRGRVVDTPAELLADELLAV